MPAIDFTYPHAMSKDDARAATERVAQDLEKQLDATYHWDGDTMRFDRSGASGHIEVRPEEVHVAIDLGLMLRPMKGRIRREAEQLLDEHLQQ